MIERHGFHSIKLKGGVLPPEDEYATTAALREAFPDHKLRLDRHFGFAGRLPP